MPYIKYCCLNIEKLISYPSSVLAPPYKVGQNHSQKSITLYNYDKKRTFTKEEKLQILKRS